MKENRTCRRGISSADAAKAKGGPLVAGTIPLISSLTSNVVPLRGRDRFRLRIEEHVGEPSDGRDAHQAKQPIGFEHPRGESGAENVQSGQNDVGNRQPATKHPSRQHQGGREQERGG